MKIKTIKINKLDKPKVYYDIEVEKYHNFSIGKANIIAHNSSLEQGIINLAQDFIGANNLPLLVPEGQFGSRLQGGKDAASSRYINTFIQDYTKIIFDKRDRPLLNFLVEDGTQIEPDRFKPIIPMVLVNGASGIGTGWSTDIPKYSTKDIIRVIENKINKKKSNRIHPSYNNLKGDMIETDNGYISNGIFERTNSTTIKITELPIGTWTHDYITHLNKLIEVRDIKEFVDHSTESEVNITINLSRENMMKLGNDESLIKKFKLASKIHTSNMNLFVDNIIVKFETPEQIIDIFFNKRLVDYKNRKKAILEELLKDRSKLDNQVRFIKMVISNDIKINNRKKVLIEKDLTKNKFDLHDDSYDYLLSMSIYNLSKEKIDELAAKAKSKDTEFKDIKKTKPENMWLEDLAKLKTYIK